MKVLRAIDRYLEEYFLVASLVIMVIVVFLQVVMRYVFQNSLTWSEEFARYLFLWQVWIGASFAVKKVRHLRVEALLNALTPKGKVILNILVAVISIAFVVFLGLKSARMTWLVNRTGQTTPALGIRMSIPYAAVPVGMVLMLFRLLQGLWFDLKKLIRKEV